MARSSACGQTTRGNLLLSDENLDSVEVDSPSVMVVEKFVEADSIDPLYFDASYYWLRTAGRARTSTRCCARRFEKTGRVALSRVVIGGRERTIATRTMDGGLRRRSMSSGT